ncbi:hypothetical protein GGI04_004074 [Coemansia thaxteri]|nr:hypothetical protein GGI04_004074 [Coemansia thaxteri]KAJ2481475.1 hypothetical protein EV174_003463 [Coemansia sp. RSA 2320]
MYFPSSRPSARSCGSATQTVRACPRPMTLVLQSPAPPTGIRPCLKQCGSPRAAAAHTVRFGTQLEHTRLFFKADAPRAAGCDPATALSLTGFLPAAAGCAPVVLESVDVAGSALVGCIRVHNLAFEKSVTVRLTRDAWRSFEDVPAVFERSIAGVDRFGFSVPCADVDAPTTIALCVRYRAGGQEHWDNNAGANHSVVVSPKPLSAPSTTRAPARPFSAVPPSDSRRYMRYSEALFSPVLALTPPLPRVPSPTSMRTGSPLAASHVWVPCPATLLHC